MPEGRRVFTDATHSSSRGCEKSIARLLQKDVRRARYLDPKTSRWLSADPALGEYIPLAPVNDEAKKHNQNLPGMGGIFNTVNMHLYHYTGNNPVKYNDPDGKVFFQIQEKYLMTDYPDTQKLGSSLVNANIRGCFVVSMANAVFSFLKTKPTDDLFVNIANNKENFDGSDFKFREYGKSVFGNDMGVVTGNKEAIKKLDVLKASKKEYVVFGIFKTKYGNHMVPLNDTAQNNTYNDSKVKSSKNDTNWDKRFDATQLMEIRFFEIKKGDEK